MNKQLNESLSKPSTMSCSSNDNSNVNSLLYRTDGDGMEIDKSNVLSSYTNKNIQKYQKKYLKSNNNLIDNTRIRKVQHCRSQFTQIKPNGTLIYLKPKLILNENKKKTNSLNSYGYGIEPKFIPREPFKGAVTPMILTMKKVKKYKTFKKNNVDIQVLVSQMSNLASTELENSNNKLIENKIKIIKDPKELLEENQQLENEIRILRDTNEQLEKQLRFQTQVNSELKTLLVAAVGEDLEARVQLLTEDKLQLARALLNSSQNLSTHREQVEWFAGHSEVWRSKFLASSLMVDELAKYKSILTSHINELQTSIVCLLEEHNELDVMSINIYNILIKILLKLNISSSSSLLININNTTTIDLIKSSLIISELIGNYLLGNDDVYNINKNNNIIITSTNGEMMAQQILTKINSFQNPNSMMYKLLLNKSTSTSTSTTKCIHCSSNSNSKSNNN